MICASCNIPVQFRCDIKGGSSPFIKEDKIQRDSNQNGIHFLPQPPAEPPSIPGEVLLDYIPPHPALSNPRKNHRYLFSLLESNTIGSKIDTCEFQTLLKSVQESGQRPEMNPSARFSLGPTYKWIKDHGMNLVGYGLFTSVWNRNTCQIYKGLGNFF